MDSERLEQQYKGEDIISRLPDDVLSHIISRLEVEDAVKTSVLSTRWKNVWTLIYNFCFNSTTYGNEENRGTLFVNFVEHVLCRSQSKSIQKFHIKTRYDFQESDAARLIELICWAVDRNVCSLTLKIKFAEVETPMTRLPHNILTCKSLVKLSLGFYDFVLEIPECTACFSCLKFLSIYIYRPNSHSLQKLFRSCPILEELKIKGFYEMDGNASTFDINMPTLKMLKIHFWTEYYIDDILVHRFVVKASNLEYLDLCGYLACVLVGETPFVDKVIKGVVEHPGDEATMREIEFFRAISSTRFLSLDRIYMSELWNHYGNLPIFPNLIYLGLGIDIVAGFALLAQFLNNSPNLEVLVLEDLMEYIYGEDEVAPLELEYVPSCMLNLKEIYLCSMYRYGKDLKVIKCLLENSKVLQRFSILIWPCMDKQEIQNEILNFPRASPICEIEFVDYSCKEKLLDKLSLI